MNEELPLQPLTLVSDELTPVQKIRLQLLANTHMGQQVMTDFVLNPTPATYESLDNLEQLAQWVLEPILQNHTNQSELIESAKKSSQPIASSHSQLITPEQFKDQQKVMGKPIKQWATENNFPYWLVIRVLNGQSKATLGMAHDCAVKMGIKADSANLPK